MVRITHACFPNCFPDFPFLSIWQWEELYRNKPDENYEDPEDCEAIDRAEKTIGDFKLKTAPDFVVPENERVNAEKKRAELFNLQREVSFSDDLNYRSKLLPPPSPLISQFFKQKTSLYSISYILFDTSLYYIGLFKFTLFICSRPFFFLDSPYKKEVQ